MKSIPFRKIITQYTKHKVIMSVYRYDSTGRTEDKIGKVVVDGAIAVHKEFGQDLYEIVNEVV